MNKPIQSQIEVVIIKEVEQNLRQIKQEYFSESELLKISSKHLQTLAGFYATKIALKKLIDQMNPKNTINENQIILMHDSRGKPYIKNIVSMTKKDINKFFISISHTSDNAYGFASIQKLTD